MGRGARRNIPREAVFEIYQEAYDPPLGSLAERLRGTDGYQTACLHSSFVLSLQQIENTDLSKKGLAEQWFLMS
jgi:hypothetical protein